MTTSAHVAMDRFARYAVVFFMLSAAGVSLGCRRVEPTATPPGAGSAYLLRFPRTPEQLKGPLWRRMLGRVRPQAYA